MQRSRLLLSALTLSALLASQAMADHRPGHRDSDRQMRNADRQTRNQRMQGQRPDRQSRSAQRQSQPGTAAGQVQRTKKVGVRDADVEHLIVLLKTRSGKAAIVDLGPVKDLADVDIATGDTLLASGRVVAVGDRQVLMADVLRKDGQQRQIQRQRPSARQGGQGHRTAFRDRQGQQGKGISGTGRIIRTKKVNVRDAGIEHLVVLLKTKQGDARVVDLGPVKNLRRVKVASGDTLAVTGDVVAVGDKQVLMATKIRADGKDLPIKRQQPQQRRPQQRQQPQQQKQRRDSDLRS